MKRAYPMERAGFRPGSARGRTRDWATAAARAAIVDLTPRLPAPARDLGWHVAKALAPGHQPLRMSERHDWSWSPERLNLPERVWGLPCGVPAGEVAAVPHPFI